VALTGRAGCLLGFAKPRASGAKLDHDRLRFALRRGLVALEFAALVSQARAPRLELRPLQLLLARIRGKLPLGFPPTFEFDAGVRQAISGCDQRALCLIMGMFGLPITSDTLFTPRLGLANGIAQPGQVAGRFGFVEVVDLGEQGCSRALQLAMLGLDRVTLLSKGGHLGRQGGILSPGFEGNLPGSLELAARRRTDGLRVALRLPSRIDRKDRRREIALRLAQPAVRRCRFPVQLHQPGALLEPRCRAAPRVGSAHEAVPAPQAAIRTDQSLTLAQLFL
jgi:hypothetical protein